MEDELILSEKDRAKLDGIVQRMSFNKESDDAIQFVVNDFKKKYGVKKKEQAVSPQEPSLAKQESTVSQLPSEPSAKVTPSRQPLKPQSEARSLGLDKQSIYNNAARSIVDDAIAKGDITESQVEEQPQVENIFKAIVDSRAKRITPAITPREIAETERIQALRQAQGNAPYLQYELEKSKNRELNLNKRAENEKIWNELQQSVKGTILEAVPEDKRQDKEYLKKLETDLWLNEGVGMDLSGDKRFNDQNFAIDAAAALARGGRGIIRGLQSVVGIEVDQFGIPYEISDALFDDEMRRNTTQFEQDFFDSLKDSEFSNAARIALNTTAESAPIMLAAGPASLQNPMAGLAMLSSLSAAQVYGEVKNEEWFKKLEPMGQLGYVGISGLAEGVGELAGARAATRALRGLAVSATKEASQKALSQYFKGLVYNGTLNVSENAIGEGITGVTQYVNDAVAQGTDVSLDGAIDAFKRSAAAGVGMAGVLTAPTVAVEVPIVLANKMGRNFEVKKIDAAIKKRKEELLQAPTAADRQVIANDILELTKRRNGEMKSSVQYFESMTPEDRATTYALSLELEDMAQQRLASEDETAKDILASKMMDTYNQIKTISQRYDTTQEAGVPSGVVQGETVVEAEPVEGAGAETPQAGGNVQEAKADIERRRQEAKAAQGLAEELIETFDGLNEDGEVQQLQVRTQRNGKKALWSKGADGRWVKLNEAPGSNDSVKLTEGILYDNVKKVSEEKPKYEGSIDERIDKKYDAELASLEQIDVKKINYEAEVSQIAELPIFQQMQKGNFVDIKDADAAQEQILEAIGRLDSMPQGAEREAATELLTELFDEIDYYDNKTEIIAEDVTERVPVGAPKRVERPKAERVDKLPLQERLQFAPVRVGDERYGALSFLEVQPDGNVDVVTYRRAAPEEIAQNKGETWVDGVARIEQRRVVDAFPRTSDVEYVESIFDDNGRIMGVRVRKRTPLGQDVSPQTFVILNRTEELAKMSKLRETAEDANLALDIAIQGQIEQLGDVPQYDFEQAYESVTRRVEKVRKVEPKKRPSKPETKTAQLTRDEADAKSNLEVSAIGTKLKGVSPKTANVIDRYLSVLFNIAPDIKFVAHYTQESIDSTLAEEQRTGDIEGYYDAANNEIHVLIEPTTDKEISKNEFRVIRHEIIHPIVDALVAKDALFANRLTNEIRKLVETAPDAIARTAAMRRMRVVLKSGDAKEIVTEFAAQFSEPELFDLLDQSPSFMDRVKNLLNRILNFLGVTKRIQNKKELLDFLTEMRNSFAAGKAVRIDKGALVRSALNKYQFSTREEKQNIIRRFMSEDAEVRVDINEDIVPAAEIKNLNPALSNVLPLIEKLSVKMKLPFVVVNDKKFNYASKVGFFNFPDLRTGTITDQMMPVDAVEGFRKKGYNIPKDLKSDKYIVINAAARNVDQSIYGYSAVFIEMLKENSADAFNTIMSSIVREKTGADPIVNMAISEYQQMIEIAQAEGVFEKAKKEKVYGIEGLNEKGIREALAYTALADAFQTYIRDNFDDNLADINSVKQVVDAAKPELEEQLRPTPLTIQEFTVGSRLDDFANLLKSASEVPAFSDYKAQTIEEAKNNIIASLKAKVDSKENSADAVEMANVMDEQSTVFKTGSIALNPDAILYAKTFHRFLDSKEYTYQSFSSPYNPGGYDGEYGSFEMSIDALNQLKSNAINDISLAVRLSNIGILNIKKTESTLKNNPIFGKLVALIPNSEYVDTYINTERPIVSKLSQELLDKIEADSKEGILYVRKKGDVESATDDSFHKFKVDGGEIVDARTGKALSEEQDEALADLSENIEMVVGKLAIKIFKDPNYMMDGLADNLFPDFKESLESILDEIGYQSSMPVFRVKPVNGLGGYKVFEAELSEEVSPEDFFSDPRTVLDEYIKLASNTDNNLEKRLRDIESKGAVSIADLEMTIADMGSKVMSDSKLYDRSLSFDYVWQFPKDYMGLDVVPDEFDGGVGIGKQTNLKENGLKDTYTLSLTYNPTANNITVGYESNIFKYQNVPPYLNAFPVFARTVELIPSMFPDIEYAALEFNAAGENKSHPLYEAFSNKVNEILNTADKDSKEYKTALDIQEKSHKFDERTDGARRIALNNLAYVKKVGREFALKVHDETLVSDHYASLGTLYAIPNKQYEKYIALMDAEGESLEPEEIEQRILQDFGGREVITLPEIEEKADKLGMGEDEYVEEFISMFNAYGMRGETIFIPKIFTNLNSPTQFTKSAVQFSKRIKLSPLEESAEDVALEKVAKASYDSDKEYAERMKLFNSVQKNILSKNAWLDRQADIREALVDGGLDYVENLLSLRAGAQANATDLFNRAEKKIYRDLSRGEVEALDQIIFMRRVIQIDSNWDKRKEVAEANLDAFEEKMRIDIKAIDELIKGEKKREKPDKKFISDLENDKMNIREQRDKLKEIASDYAERPKHPKGLNGEEAIQAITAMERKLGATQFGKLNMRADAYFTEFRGILKSYEANGLIDEATYERFSKDDYEPRKFIEKIFEDLDDEVFARAGTGLKQDVLKAIQEGSEGNLLMDSRMLLSLAYKSAEAKRFQNLANAELASEITPDTADFARNANYIELPDGRTATDQYGNARVAPADKGFSNVFYKEKGKTRAFQLRNDLVEQWNDTNRSYFGAGSRTKKVLSALSGAPILRIFATGYNITFGFGLVVPESLAVVLARGRVYGKDSFLPIALLKMAKDYATGIYSKATDQDLVRDYFAHGGGMSFMSQEFRPEYRFREKYKNRLEYILAKRWDKVAKGIAFTGETFEIGIRLAVYSRMIKNLKEQYPDLAKTKDGIEKIKFMAAAEARNIVDFSKGGKLTKDLDAIAPYLNVAFQATMSTFNGIKDNPEKFAAKFFQYATGIMGLVFYNILTYGDDYDDIDPYMRYRYHVILLPTKDENGNRKYIRLKKPQALLPLTVPLEMLAQSWASTINGKPKKFTEDEVRLAWENAADGLPFFVPGIDKSFDLMNRIPVASVIAKSVFNYDSFRNATIVPEYIFGEVKPYAESRASDKVEFFYKAIAKASESEYIPDVSAPRLKAGVESIITNPTTNFLVGVAYGVLDLAARAATDVMNVQDVDLSEKQREEKAEDRVTRELKGIKENAQKVFVRSTNPNWRDYIKKQGVEQEIKLEESTEDFIISEKIKALAKKHKEQGHFDKNGKRYQEELGKILSDVKPEKRERLGRKYFYTVASSDADKSLMSIRFADTQSEAARVFYEKFGKLEPEEFNDVMRDLRGVGFRPNEEFYAVVRKLYTQKEK